MKFSIVIGMKIYSWEFETFQFVKLVVVVEPQLLRF